MEESTVAQFAGELSLPVGLLLEQLQAAGVAKQLGSDSISKQDKAQLLEHLHSTHGSGSAKSKKITLNRSETTEIKKADSTGKAGIIQDEVHKTRVVTPITTTQIVDDVIKQVQAELSALQAANAQAKKEHANREAQAKIEHANREASLVNDFFDTEADYNAVVEKIKQEISSIAGKLEDDKSSNMRKVSETPADVVMPIEFTLIDLIQQTVNAPVNLNKLSAEFLKIEADYNSTVEKIKHGISSIVGKLEDAKSSIKKKLEYEKTSITKKLEDEESHIQQTYNSAVSLVKNKHDKEIFRMGSDYRSGKYVKPILLGEYREWKNNKASHLAAKWITVGFSVILIYVGWYSGILIGPLGYYIFNNFQEKANNNIRELDKYLKNTTFDQQELLDLGKVSADIKMSIEDGAKNEKKAIEAIKKSFADEYAAIDGKENFILKQKLSDLKISREQILSDLVIKKHQILSNVENKQRQIISEIEMTQQQILSGLSITTNEKIVKIKSRLNSIIKEINQLPETFDNNSFCWQQESILKAQEMIACNLRIGQETINILTDTPSSLTVPRCIPFFNRSNIIFNCTNQEEAKCAINISHNIVARTLLSLPANKTKITFIDPVELGGNAAPFTPLLKEIYGGRIFTQADDIDNQLSVLTRAIESIIQQYLQDKYPDIATYNLATKEVSEPYRLLVVYNFPRGFNDTTAKKLLNIIRSGPKTGIHTILISDRTAALPYGLDWELFNVGVEVIAPNASVLSSANRHFEFDQCLPCNEIVDFINKAFPNTNSLKVPFSKYIPEKACWWKDKAHKQFSVPIGRHATEVQSLTFDNDDDNQALLIGKPGSGKSNLLHAIIANSLWKYSPDQIEIYLIDFKGGVEFTIYADKKIPHIKAIAIESDREFGLSVLDGVERILLEREKVFSRSSVLNIEEYHVKLPDKRMPRILLIVDEFQEFYSEDDHIKQAVDDKFDRIIRKGRAFGINTLFSSQSLSGNSINKSTKELIDIRIALMCSDTDANQILDDRNPAARDLTRPGEGIYNAENGKVGGNKRFQAFFVEKDALHKTIEGVVNFAKSQPNQETPFKQDIFRGSERAHLEKEGHPIAKVCASATPKSLKLWLGEPIAIADDVTSSIRKQGGSNLLVAGSDESAGLRVMASSIISIAVQHQQDTAKFYYFNFFNVDSELVNVPHELFNNIQQQSENVGSRDVKNALQSIKEDIIERLLEGASDNHNIYLAFFSFQRGRAFRKDGYTMSGEGDLLSFILKEGPDVGVFAMVQVDTMDNFSKNLDDSLLREFSQRVATQMNPDNSVKIIGNQKAAKLSNNRAWYYDDNENTLTKFKPYELPSYSWVLQLQNKSSAALS